MRIKKLILENFRLFEHLEVDFPDSNFIVLIGNNGGGKTTLLDATSKAISQLIKEMGSALEDTMSNSDIKRGKEKSDIIASFDLWKKEIDVICTWQIGHGNNRIVQFEYIEEILNEIKSKSIKNLPILTYYRVNRTNVIPEISLHSIENPILLAYSEGLASRNSAFTKFENWFINELNIENENKVDKKADSSYELPSLAHIRKAFKNFLSIIGEEKITDIRIARDEVNLDFNVDNRPFAAVIKNGVKLRFSQLSSGEKMIMYMVSDIARRLTIANSHSEDALNGEGIVLIDELDLHLHPRWQKSIVNALTNTFPNVQFIVTTHSPIVLSGVRREQIIVLNDGVIIPNTELPNIYSGTADEILEDILFAPKASDEFEDEKKEIDELFNSHDFDSAERKLQDLKNKVKAAPKWLKDYENRIAFVKA